jgi:beta-lactam-binding protein with PASTA domain
VSSALITLGLGEADAGKSLLLFGLAPDTPDSPYVPATDVVGLGKDAAIAAVIADGFVPNPREDYSSVVAKGVVIRQFPHAGVDTSPGAMIAFWVSLGPPAEVIVSDAPEREFTVRSVGKVRW